MLEANEKLVQEVRESMVVPAGFTARVMISEDHNNDNYKGLAFSFRKKVGRCPKKEVFDFGILFYKKGCLDKDFDSYIESINIVLAIKVQEWESVIKEREEKKTKKKK